MKHLSVALLVSFLLSMPCIAQSQQAATAEPTLDIDEVVVVRGWRHPVQLRLRMVEAELAVYDLFNRLNDDASLQIDCHKRNVGGTRLQTTDCAPRFESQARAQEGRDTLEMYRASLNAMAATGPFSTVFPGPANQMSVAEATNSDQFVGYIPSTMGMSANQTIQIGQSRLQKKMQAIAAEHPEFVDAIKSYVDSKTLYTQSLRRVDD